MARDLFNRYIWLVDTLRMTYKSFWKPDGHTVEVGPYFIKIFRQRKRTTPYSSTTYPPHTTSFRRYSRTAMRSRSYPPRT